MSFQPKRILFALDDKCSDLSDAAIDWLWDWLGLRRSTLARGLAVMLGALWLRRSVAAHQWWAVFLDGFVFMAFYSVVDRKDLFYTIVRICALLIIVPCVPLGTLLFGIEPEGIGLVLYLWYLYVCNDRRGPREKRAPRHRLTELLKMFGGEWVPKPVREEA